MIEPADHTLAAKLARLPALVEADATLLRRGRFANVDLVLELGTMPVHLGVREGRVASLQRGPAIMRSWSFAIRGSEEAWRKFWMKVPPPGFHDLFALAKFGAVRIEGDFRPLMTHLLYFKGLLALPRTLAEEARA